jgi:hypothetical protein
MVCYKWKTVYFRPGRESATNGRRSASGKEDGLLQMEDGLLQMEDGLLQIVGDHGPSRILGKPDPISGSRSQSVTHARWRFARVTRRLKILTNISFEHKNSPAASKICRHQAPGKFPTATLAPRRWHLHLPRPRPLTRHLELLPAPAFWPLPHPRRT